MDWLFDNLQFVVAVIVFIVWTLSAAKKQKEAAREEEERRQRQANRGTGGAETAEEERTRQIQEEIRRRILARQRGETVAPPPMPAEQQPTVVVLEEPEEVEEPEYLEEGPRPRQPVVDHAAAILEQQRRLEEQLQAVRAARSLAAAAVPRMPSTSVSARYAPNANWRRSLRRDLVHPSSVRRAILLKEVLGDPVGLQRGMPQLPRR